MAWTPVRPVIATRMGRAVRASRTATSLLAPAVQADRVQVARVRPAAIVVPAVHVHTVIAVRGAHARMRIAVQVMVPARTVAHVGTVAMVATVQAKAGRHARPNRTAILATPRTFRPIMPTLVVSTRMANARRATGLRAGLVKDRVPGVRAQRVHAPAAPGLMVLARVALDPAVIAALVAVETKAATADLNNKGAIGAFVLSARNPKGPSFDECNDAGYRCASQSVIHGPMSSVMSRWRPAGPSNVESSR
jgi:hypothetical protein